MECAISLALLIVARLLALLGTGVLIVLTLLFVLVVVVTLALTLLVLTLPALAVTALLLAMVLLVPAFLIGHAQTFLLTRVNSHLEKKMGRRLRSRKRG